MAAEFTSPWITIDESCGSYFGLSKAQAFCRGTVSANGKYLVVPEMINSYKLNVMGFYSYTVSSQVNCSTNLMLNFFTHIDLSTGSKKTLDKGSHLRKVHSVDKNGKYVLWSGKEHVYSMNIDQCYLSRSDDSSITRLEELAGGPRFNKHHFCAHKY